MTPGSCIRFGIPKLDELIGGPSDTGLYGLDLKSSKNAVTLCIIGPDGSGKSLFGLHLASRYAADLAHAREDAKVLYVSTDLRYHMAETNWDKFGLNTPDTRIIPFCQDLRLPAPDRDAAVSLQECPYQELSGFLQSRSRPESSHRTVTFVDLATETAGDDWQFLNRTLAALRRNPKEELPRHLVVVDAVEGFETFVGDRDAFGELSPRRSRIAQLVRAAGKSVHLALVVEEARDGRRWPEEFVSDLVIRLRCPIHGAYTRRTVEIVKARGQGHARGEHPVIIRDDAAFQSVLPRDPDVTTPTNHYIHVFPSLNFLSRGMMKVGKPERAQLPVHRFAAFGIPNLDDMLAGDHSDSGQHQGFDKRGIPIGTVTALIGDTATKKSGLGDAFLARGFLDYACELASVIQNTPGSDVTKLRDRVARAQTKLAKRRRNCAAVLISTNDIGTDELVRKFLPHWCTEELGEDLRAASVFRKAVESHILKQTLCKRLEIHDLSTPALFHVIEQSVYEAYKRVGFTGDLDAIPPHLAGRVRLVIDDFSTMTDMYPDIEKDPIFLPYLFSFLTRAGITTLVIETNPAQPDLAVVESMDSNLRALVKNHLHTWRVPFYGESRVAIAAIPPFSGDLALIRELRTEERSIGKGQAKQKVEMLTVDPGFELYHGLEHGNPQPVPLEIRLYAEGIGFDEYLRQANELFSKVFSANERPASEPSGTIINVCRENYDSLRDLANLQRDVRLNHSLVFQIDEFWTPEGTESIRDQIQYLTAFVTKNRKAVEVNDPFALFQPTRAVPERSRPDVQRIDRFIFEGVTGDGRSVIEPGKPLARIPYTWDFGFLLGRRGPWMTASRDLQEGNALEDVPGGVTGIRKLDKNSIGWLSDEVQKALPRITHEKLERRDGPIWSWREFLGVCRVVAKHDSVRYSRPARAFDLTITMPSTMTCWILEVWSSEIYARGENGAAFLADCFGKYVTNHAKWDLAELADRYFKELAAALLLVAGALDLRTVVDPDSFALKCRPADPTSVATRHWYKTACEFQEKYFTNESLVALGLPGHFSVRGDWFLAVASNSRSTRLADRALDLLSSRRANIDRLQFGIGLPTRDFAPRSVRNGSRVDLTRNARTRLKAPVGGKEAHILYGELLGLGSMEAGDDEFFWFWRADLHDFDRQHRFFEKWIGDVLVRLLRVQLGPHGQELESFQAYDNFVLEEPVGIGCKMFPKNPQLRDQLVVGLRHSSGIRKSK